MWLFLLGLILRRVQLVVERGCGFLSESWRIVAGWRFPFRGVIGIYRWRLWRFSWIGFLGNPILLVEGGGWLVFLGG